MAFARLRPLGGCGGNPVSSLSGVHQSQCETLEGSPGREAQGWQGARRRHTGSIPTEGRRRAQRQFSRWGPSHRAFAPRLPREFHHSLLTLAGFAGIVVFAEAGCAPSGGDAPFPARPIELVLVGDSRRAERPPRPPARGGGATAFRRPPGQRGDPPGRRGRRRVALSQEPGWRPPRARGVHRERGPRTWRPGGSRSLRGT